jgi:competence protein ComEC
MGRFPAASAAIACCLGIIADRYFPFPEAALFAVAILAIAVWFGLRTRRPREAAASVLFLCSAVAALHHHQWWHTIPESDIGRFAKSDRVLVRLQGTVSSRPEVIPADVASQTSFAREDITRLELTCRAVDVQQNWRAVTGRLRVTVKGRATELFSGDEVVLTGWIRSLPRVRNPGGFDFGQQMRRDRIRAMLFVENPALIKVRTPGATWLTRLRQYARARCEMVLERGLSEQTRSIGLAMLLGTRSQIAPEVRNAFIVSGTIHILAISGLHVGILAAFLLGSARVLRLSNRATFVGLVVCLGIYLLIADLRPPMLRAYVLIVVWSLSRWFRRASLAPNRLAIAALIILVMNPTDLFDTGAQLSFLAVASIFWLSAVTVRFRQAADVAADPNSDRAKAVLRPDWVNLLLEWLRVPFQWWIVSCTIWLLGVPLVAYAWHVIPVIGIVVNSLFLIPLVAAGLWTGFLAILVGAVWQPLSLPFVFLFDVTLRLLMGIVDVAASVPFGHVHVPSPPLWWLGLFYTIVAIAMLATLHHRRPHRFWVGVALWTVFGFSVGTRAETSSSLKCTVLSVGHGLSVLVETPSGHTLLYDVGSQFGGDTAARIVEGVLREKRLMSLDALVISHADSDHYAGVQPLLRSISTTGLYVSRHFIDSDEPDTLDAVHAAERRGIPLHIVSRGDQIPLGPDVSIRVLHPDASRNYTDNGASIVLEILYRGRRILLTGDLRDRGLSEVLNMESRSVDLLLSPHHGDPKSNTPELARWAAPRLVVASSKREFDPARLQRVYGPESLVLSTSQVGAVEVQIAADGSMSHSTYFGANE